MSGLSEYWKKIAPSQDFRVTIVAFADRNKVIWESKENIYKHHGDIINFKMFSDLALNLNVEISSENLKPLLQSFESFGWKVECTPTLEELISPQARMLAGTIQITFPEARGDLTIPVPMVPG